jgi:DNA-damage-inducible protein J
VADELNRKAEMPATTMIHVRVDQTVKEVASATLAKLGISMSDAIRIMLARVAAEKALPFDIRVPNAATVKAIRSAGQGKRFRSVEALFRDLGI